MAQKQIHIKDIGDITLQKRKGARSIRLTVAHDGTLKVSLPSWSPYSVGEAFVRSKTQWILEHKAGKSQPLLRAGQRIGKAHRICFIQEPRSSIISRVTKNEITLRAPNHIDWSEKGAQQVLAKAAIRALKQEAGILLPQRLQTLAALHGFTYRSVSIKRLKARWGSCSSQKDIALNCFLMQLPWELIDYVLMHELLHTRVMAHGPKFWSELENYVVDLPAKRKAIRLQQPALIGKYC